MISDKQLFVIGNSKFQVRHLLIIGILTISFSICFMIRSQSADYGFELNEFDPYFNYRATQYIVDNGLAEYFLWNDDKSWHTLGGRDVSESSQIMLHVTAAFLYQIFGFNSSLLDFTILFPVIFGALSTIVIFALVRVIGGTSAGLFASLFFAISVPLILRGMLGWFKSEPLGIFYGLLGLYLFLSGIKSQNKKVAFIKIITSGIILAVALSAWGGTQFFLLPLALFFLSLPFFRKDSNFIIWAIPLFSSTLLLTTLLFERPGIEFVLGLGGFTIGGSTIFMVIIVIIQKFSVENHKIRNGIIFLIFSIVLATLIIEFNPVNETGQSPIHLPSFRYLNAMNPFLTTTDPLTDSVAEHATLSLENSFRYSSIFLIFAGIGAWLLLRNKEKINKNLFIENDMIVFSLILCLLGVYVSSTFVRLELFASISLIIFSSIGLSIITKEIFSRNITQDKTKKKKYKNIDTNPIKSITKFSYVVIIIALLLIPITLPQDNTWINAVKGPPTILNGGTNFLVVHQDWPDSMTWLKNNTSEDSIVVAWWDYGYWITTLGERITVADNATLSTIVIQNIARIFLSTPDDAWISLNQMDGDYILIFIAAEKISTESGETSLYILRGGGEESKKNWFIKIAEEPLEKFIQSDGFSGTDYFWNDTLLGQMFPFTTIAYINPNNPIEQSATYVPGFIGIYEKTIKFPSDGNGPLKLVYESESLKRTTPGAITGILIYEINKDYKPST